MEFVEDEEKAGSSTADSTTVTTEHAITASEQQKMIRDVQSDTSLSTTEKNEAIKQIMKRQIQVAKVEKEACKHYEKKCANFYFECCQTYDSCHRCHAEYNNCTKRDIKSITCTECNTEQDISNKCISCDITFSHSFCSLCKIWTAVDIFHCDGCGICRVGKAENYVHCDNCNGCFSVTAEHACQLFKPLDQLECLVCMESAHTSQDSIYPLPCGHVMHSKCLNMYLDSNQYRCPTCRKSVCDMTATWANYKNTISAQDMPEQYRKNVEILCYDCSKECTAAFHFLGMECGHCGSYNTSSK